MTKRFDRRLLDVNALVMGNGVSLAALESMFNLVGTQSVLAANMVRQQDMGQAAALESLALAMSRILEAGEGAPRGRQDDDLGRRLDQIAELLKTAGQDSQHLLSASATGTDNSVELLHEVMRGMAQFATPKLAVT